MREAEAAVQGKVNETSASSSINSNSASSSSPSSSSTSSKRTLSSSKPEGSISSTEGEEEYFNIGTNVSDVSIIAYELTATVEAIPGLPDVKFRRIRRKELDPDESFKRAFEAIQVGGGG